MKFDETFPVCDYDVVFDNNPDYDYFYNAPGYYGPKLVVGRVSLRNAIERLKKEEIYTVVKYHEGDKLPKEYVPLTNINVEGNGTLFATINPEFRVNYICARSGIQQVGNISSRGEEPIWFLGPGPDTVTHSFLVNSQLSDYEKVNQK